MRRPAVVSLQCLLCVHAVGLKGCVAFAQGWPFWQIWLASMASTLVQLLVVMCPASGPLPASTQMHWRQIVERHPAWLLAVVDLWACRQTPNFQPSNSLPSPACRLEQQGKSAWAGDRNSRCVPPAPSIGQPRVFASALICRGAGVCMPAHLMHQVSNSCTRSDQCTHHTTEVLSKGQGRTQGSRAFAG